MTPPPQEAADTDQPRPEWLPEGISVIEHVRKASKQLGPPPELDLPDPDWDWDPDDLLAEAWRTRCIPEAQLRRALGAKGVDKPWWWTELSTASGNPVYVRDRPEITMAAASGQLGERAEQTYHRLVDLGLIANTAPRQPDKPTRRNATTATTLAPGADVLPKAHLARVSRKTVEISLTTASKRRYRADTETLDTLLAAAASTGRLDDPRRLEAAQIGDDVELTALPGSNRQAARIDGTATAVAEPTGAKIAEITLTATSTRRYRATDTEAPSSAPPPRHSKPSTTEPENNPSHTPLDKGASDRPPPALLPPPRGSAPEIPSWCGPTPTPKRPSAPGGPSPPPGRVGRPRPTGRTSKSKNPSSAASTSSGTQRRPGGTAAWSLIWGKR